MNARFVALLSFLSLPFAFANPKPVWTILEGLQNPESSYYDEGSDAIYVSNVAGNATDRDSIGWISQISPTGKVINPKWLEGFDAPKGLRSHNKKLWVTNITEIISIDIPMSKIHQRIPVPGAKFLNDVAICPDGTVYVSDMLTNRIHSLDQQGANLQTFLETKEAPNGLYCDGQKLWVANWGIEMAPDFSTKTAGQITSVDLKTKAVVNATKPLGNLDGLEPVGQDWFVSDWVLGKVFRVSVGKPTLFLDGFKGSADLGWVPGKRLLLVPEMKESRLFAYQIAK